MRRHAQTGAAILLAMLVVALVATLATTAYWTQWRATEVERAESTRSQAHWVLQGALGWAQLILEEDGRKGGSDHLAEPWAVPLASARLSRFLAMDQSDALAADAAEAAFLSGEIIDAQSRLNMTNLVRNGTLDPAAQTQWRRLYQMLGLPLAELDMLQSQVLRAVLGRSSRNSADAAPLWPRTLDQAAWLGLPAHSIAVLRPFATVLPERTPLNLNTAGAEVLVAAVDGLDAAQAQSLLLARQRKPWDSVADFSAALGPRAPAMPPDDFSTATRYFELHARLQIEAAQVEEIALVRRDGAQVRTLWHQRAAANPASGS